MPELSPLRPSWPTLPVIFAQPAIEALLAWLDLAYGDIPTENGNPRFVEVAYIDGDPSAEGNRTRSPHNGQHWQRFMRAETAYRGTLARLLVDLIGRYGNVYVSIGVYHRDAQGNRDRKVSLVTNRVIFLDDARRELAEYGSPSGVLQTSPSSQQHLYRLSRPVSGYEYQQIIRVAQPAAGSDPASIDPTHVMRVPGAFNTKAKYGQPYRAVVRSIDPDAVIDVDLLLSRPEARTARTNSGLTVMHDSAAWAEAAKMNHASTMQHGGPFFRDDGSLRRLGLRAQLVNEAVRTGVWNPPAGWDATPSGWRSNLIYALWKHGYPDVEIRALCLVLLVDHARGRGWEAIQIDVDRILAKLDAEHPRDRVSATQGYTERPHRAVGRPAGAAEEARAALLASLHAGELVTRATLAERVARVGVDLAERTITAHLRALVDAGRVGVQYDRRGIRVLWVANNSTRLAEVGAHLPPTIGASECAMTASEGIGDHPTPQPPTPSEPHAPMAALAAEGERGGSDSPSTSDAPPNPDRRAVLSDVRRLARAAGGAALLVDYESLSLAELEAAKRRLQFSGTDDTLAELLEAGADVQHRVARLDRQLAALGEPTDPNTQYRRAAYQEQRDRLLGELGRLVRPVPDHQVAQHQLPWYLPAPQRGAIGVRQ